jgi:hypothetical protein
MATASESSAGSARATPPGWTVRGKWFVAPFVIVLVLLLCWTLAIALQFQTIMTRLDLARTDWPAASQDLAKHFEQFHARVQDRDPTLANVSRESWNEAYTAFQQTSQYDRQAVHAATLQRICSDAPQGTGLAPTSIPDTPSLSKLRRSEQERLDAQHSTVGRWAITALRLKLPATFFANQ